MPCIHPSGHYPFWGETTTEIFEAITGDSGPDYTQPVWQVRQGEYVCVWRLMTG